MSQIQVDDLLNNDGLFSYQIKSKSILSEKFGIPPFSVINTQTAEWQNRKKSWINLGIQSEKGRSSKSYNIHDWIENKRTSEGFKSNIHGDGISIFDPALCEFVYKWFCPPSGQIIDPFCGGSVRGIVAGCMGLKYWGCDLNTKQIEENYNQAKIINPIIYPIWTAGDSNKKLIECPPADFIFTCPPYGNLEKYSDHPDDLSNMKWDIFLKNYNEIIKKACDKLIDNRFACFVVSNFRNEKGYYNDLVGNTVKCFQICGLEFYNDMVLLNIIGSACLRYKQFESGRKVVKIHQNVLIFVKGNPKRFLMADS